MKTYLLTDEVQIIGRAGEQGGIAVAVDVSDWQEAYQDGVGSMRCQRPDGKYVPLTCTISDNLMLAVLPDECISRPGTYTYTANWALAGVLIQSQVYRAIIQTTGNGRGMPHDYPGTPEWATEIFVKAEQILSATDAALQASTAAEAAETGAEAAQQAAAAAKTGAEAAQTGAVAAKTAAQTAQAAAEAAQTAAEAAYASTSGVLDDITAAVTAGVATVEAEGTEQAGAVASAGATQIAAVEAKGAETIASIPQDYTALSDDVDDLKSAFTSLQESFTTAVPSRNLYDKDSCNPQDQKTYNNTYGNIADSSVGAITGKIPVSENTQYIFSCGNLAVVKKASYFSGETGGTYLSYETIDGAAFTTPAGCTFVGITFFNVSHTTEQYNSALAVAQLERGNEATPYVPYGSDSYTFTLPAETADEGKPLTPKTVSNGKVVEWEYKETTAVVIDNTLTHSDEAADAKAVGDIFDEITEIAYSKNLYNSAVSSPQNGKTYNASTGAVEDGTSYAISGKFPVDAETQYIFSTQSLAKVKRVFYFKGDDGGTYISSEVLDNAAFTTPAQCTYAAVNLFAATHTAEQYTNAINASMLEKGNVATDFVPYSETRKVPSSVLVDGEAVEGAKNFTLIDSLVNHFDKSKCVDGKYFNNTYHEINNNTNYGFSGLIPVKPNTQYNISCDKTLAVGKMATYYQEWDVTKTFIQQTQQNYAFSYISQIQTGANTHYISINLQFEAAHTTEQFNALIDSIMLVEGMQIPPEYVAYNPEPVVNHTKLNNSYQANQVDKWRGKKWLVCGTSISYQDSHVFTEGVREGEVCRGYIGNVSRNKPMLITNAGISGSTLAKTDQTTALINRYQNLNFGDYDFISIEYGVNDFGNDVPVGTANDAAGTDTFAACLKTIIEYALAQNPVVGLIICTDPDVRGATTNNNGNTLKDYTDVTIAIAQQYRLPICDWYYRSGINALNKGDGTREDTMTQSGTHPSNYGHMRMGAILNQVFDSLLC